MNKEELKDLVVSETGRSDKDTLIYDYLEMGLKEIGTRHTFREMISETDLSMRQKTFSGELDWDASSKLATLAGVPFDSLDYSYKSGDYLYLYKDGGGFDNGWYEMEGASFVSSELRASLSSSIKDSDLTGVTGVTSKIWNKRFIELPSDYLHILECRVIDGTMSKKLRIKTKNWLVSRWPNISSHSEAKPVYGYVQSGKLYVYPIMDDRYTFRLTYSALPTMSTTSTECPIPLVESALVALAKSKLWSALEMYDKAGFSRQIYERELRSAISADRKTNEEVKADNVGTEVDAYGAEPWYDPFAKRLK
jgi:hypothetical protein